MSIYRSADPEFIRQLKEIVDNSSGTPEEKAMVFDRMAKEVALDDLAQRAVAKKTFGLGPERYQFGHGNVMSPLMVVLPWCPVDKDPIEMRDKIFKAAGFNDDNVYITYLDKWAAFGNNAMDINQLLEEEIDIINPRCILYMGDKYLLIYGEAPPKYQFFKSGEREVMITYSVHDCLQGTAEQISIAKFGLWSNIKEVLQRYKVD